MKQNAEKPIGRKAESRQRLAKAALDLFLQQGYEATTAEQIARAAGVSRRTFFRHFPTKDSVVFPAREERLEMFRDMLRRHREQSPPFRSIRKALIEFAGEYERHKEELLAQYTVVQSSPLLIAHESEFDSFYEAAIAETLLSKEVNSPLVRRQARILAGAIFGAIQRALQEWFAGKCSFDLAQLGDATLSMLEFGVGSLSFGDEILQGAGDRDAKETPLPEPR